MIQLSNLKVNKDNPRIIKDAKFEKLCNSIKSFPKMMELRPIIVDEDNMVLGGNMRLKALQSLGYTEIEDTWVKQAVGLTDEQKKEFIIKDNVGFGEWDWDSLANNWENQVLTDWGLDLRAWSDINALGDEDFGEFDGVIQNDEYFHLNITFKIEEEMNKFMETNNIILDNNFKKVNKTISIHWPLEKRRDIKNLEFK